MNAETVERASVARCDTATHSVIVLREPGTASPLPAIARALASLPVDMRSVRAVADAPVNCLRLMVDAGRADVDTERLRAAIADVAAAECVDIVVKPAGRTGPAKRLVMFDFDSTLVQGETIDELARRAGAEAEVRDLTAAAMRGEIDFAESLKRRASTLAGLDASVLGEVAASVELTPGAHTAIEALRRFGYRCGVVTGGFKQIVDPVVGDLGLDFVRANTLEVAQGRLTGRVAGAIIDRAAKAAALREFAGAAGVRMAQTVAVGDGANDIDMIAAAGLGIAFNAKSALIEVADAVLSRPSLDAVPLLLGVQFEAP